MTGCLSLLFNTKIYPIRDVSLNNLVSDIEDIITLHDVELAEKAWEHITSSTSPVFIAASVMGIVTTDSLSWFYDTFYRLIKKYNITMYNIFKDNLKVKANALIGIVTNSLKIGRRIAEHKNNIDFKKIHDFHEHLHVKYEYYGIISKVLLETFKHCLGGLWKRDMHKSWKKILDYIVKQLYYCENIKVKVSILINNVLPTPLSSRYNSINEENSIEHKETSFFQVFKNRLSQRHKINAIVEVDEETS